MLVSRSVVLQLPEFAARMLGPDAARVLLGKIPSIVAAPEHKHLIEHLLCEALKILEPARRPYYQSTDADDSEYVCLWQSCEPIHTAAMQDPKP